MRRWIRGGVMAMFAVGCAPKAFPPVEWGRGGIIGWLPDGSVPDAALALDGTYAPERPFYGKTGNADRPRTCVALSGGGLRSAAFSIGALAGLHDAGELDDVDVISAVSGGSYALAWYETQQWLANQRSGVAADPGALFDPNQDHQRWLRTHARTAPACKWPCILNLGLVGDLAALTGDALFIPVHWLVNGAFAGGRNLRLVNHLYEHRLRRIFQTDPVTRKAPSLRFEQLRPLAAAGVPLPIIAGAWFVEDRLGEHRGRVGSRLFEFTPMGFGSDVSVPRKPGDPEWPKRVAPERIPSATLSRVVAISGAALDSSEEPVAAQKILRSAMNFDLGFHVPNPDGRRPGAWAKAITPFPLYYVWRAHAQTPEGGEFLLTDGGHVENLAAFPLIRRLCQRLIVVDAENDWAVGDDQVVKFAFSSLRRLQTAVRSELGAPLTLAAWHSSQGPRTTHEPMVRGSVGPFRYRGRETSTGIDYLKLALHQDDLAIYPRSVGAYLTECLRQHGEGCTFPQEPTTEQCYSAQQFAAYRDLGRFLTCRYYRRDATYCRAAAEGTP